MSHPSPAISQHLSLAQRIRGQRAAILTQLPAGTIQFIVLGPIMLLFGTDVLRLSSQQIAGILACIPLASFPLLLLTNRLVNVGKVRLLRWADGARLLVLTTLLLTPSSSLTYGIFVVLLVLYSLAQQLGPGIVWQPLLKDITTTDDRGAFFSRMRFSFTLLTLGVTAGTPLLLGATITQWQYKVLMLLAVVGMIHRLYWSRSIPERVSKEEEQDTDSASVPTALLALVRESRLLRLPLLISIGVQLQLSSMFILYMKKVLHVPSSTISALILAGTIGSLLSLLVWGRVVDLLGHRPVLQGMLLLSFAITPLYLLLVPMESSTAVSTALYPASPTLWILVCISFLGGFLMAGLGLALTSLIHSSASTTQPVLDMKLFQIATSVAAIIISLCIGQVITMTESGTPFSLYANLLWLDPYRLYLLMCAAVSLLLFFGVARMPNSRKHGDMNDFFQLFSAITVRHFYASRLLLHEDEERRAGTARWLGEHHTASSIDSLLKMLNDPSYDVKVEAIRSLGYSGSSRAAEVLLTMLEDDNRRSLADHLCWALGKLQYQEATSSIIQHCSERYPSRIRAMAARSLGRMNDPRAISVLVTILTTERDSQHLLASACRGLLRLNTQQHAGLLFDTLCLIDHREERYKLLEVVCSWLSISSHWVLASTSSNSTYESLMNELELRSDSWKRTHAQAMEVFVQRDLDGLRQLLQAEAKDDPLRRALLNSLNKIDSWQPLAVVGSASILLR